MQYINLTLNCHNPETMDIWLARTNDLDFIGMEERDSSLVISFHENSKDLGELISFLENSGQTFEIEQVKKENWNSNWESSFEPIIVSDPYSGEPLVCVRASFHAKRPDIPKEICITPKMSFGTGHHATTLQMMQQMSHLDFSGKTIMDFGTGTGILAIYAEMLGASTILAIDNDPWCIENTNENLASNDCRLVKVECLDHCPKLEEPVDIILANINLNIIVTNLPSIIASTNTNGMILFSGILEKDQLLLETEVLESGLEIKWRGSLNKWVVLLAQKPDISNC